MSFMPSFFSTKNGLFLLLALVVMSGSLAYYIHLSHLEDMRLQQEYEEKQERERLAKIEAEKDAQFQKIVDTYLEKFTDDLGQRMRDYKKNRKMVKELIQPFNHETPEDSKNSYEHFTQTLMPYLKAQSSEVIDTFSRYKVALDKDLIDESSSRKDRFRRQWNDMTENQINKYVDYFIKEDRLLSRYQALIEFYYVHSNLITVDIEEDAFVFKRKQDEIKHLDLLKQLKDAG